MMTMLNLSLLSLLYSFKNNYPLKMISILSISLLSFSDILNHQKIYNPDLIYASKFLLSWIITLLLISICMKFSYFIMMQILFTIMALTSNSIPEVIIISELSLMMSIFLIFYQKMNKKIMIMMTFAFLSLSAIVLISVMHNKNLYHNSMIKESYTMMLILIMPFMIKSPMMGFNNWLIKIMSKFNTLVNLSLFCNMKINIYYLLMISQYLKQKLLLFISITFTLISLMNLIKSMKSYSLNQMFIMTMVSQMLMEISTMTFICNTSMKQILLHSVTQLLMMFSMMVMIKKTNFNMMKSLNKTKLKKTNSMMLIATLMISMNFPFTPGFVPELLMLKTMLLKNPYLALMISTLVMFINLNYSLIMMKLIYPTSKKKIKIKNFNMKNMNFNMIILILSMFTMSMMTL